MTLEIVDLLIENGGSFQFAICYVTNSQRVSPIESHKTTMKPPFSAIGTEHKGDVLRGRFQGSFRIPLYLARKRPPAGRTFSQEVEVDSVFLKVFVQ